MACERSVATTRATRVAIRDVTSAAIAIRRQAESESNIKFMFIGLTLLLVLTSMGCCPCLNLAERQHHDPQILQIYMHTGYRDEIDTFQGFLQKDLVPDTIRIPFGFTTREQEIILSKLESSRFFSFPDTIHAEPNVTESPNGGAQILRVKYADKDKAVVWFYPPERSSKFFSLVLAIRNLIYDIAVSRPEYKALPQPKAGYQ
jgi:hypothetical protein